jgi:hypothetical protein
MTFSTLDKLKARAIVNVFETSEPFGDYAACVVLNDGAGVSYGISQFTHRSGALLAVVERYIENGGTVGRTDIEKRLPLLRRKTAAAIGTLASEETFKKALIAASITSEMRAAQTAVAFERYLNPAIKACEGSGFLLPLSLAVIYDSMNHGSWERIRDSVKAIASPDNEKHWITDYVIRRHQWLRSVPRLKPTAYRTRFFLEQIARGNWDLKFPLDVHGVRVDESDIDVTNEDSAVGSNTPQQETSAQPEASHPSTQPDSSKTSLPHSPAQPPNVSSGEKVEAGEFIDCVEDRVDRGAARFDQVERIVTTVIARTDAAKSLWTTVIGTISQTAWAIFGLLAGVPREVWLVVAIIAAAFTLAYLYRQIALGKLRESQNHLRELVGSVSGKAKD